MKLDGNTILITGGASGIGFEMAKQFLKLGNTVIITGRNKEKLAKAHQQLPALKTIVSDVSDPSAIKSLFTQVTTEFPKLNVLINNAGISTGPKRLHELAIEDWDRLMAINLRGVFLCSRAAIPMMLEGGSGSIINIASIAGLVGYYPGSARLCANYAASKAGVIGLTRQVAMEYARDGIRVNAIAPGWHGGTRLGGARLAALSPEELTRLETMINDRIPMGHRGVPDDLVGLAIYLASSASSYVTGQVIAHDGGWSAE